MYLKNKQINLQLNLLGLRPCFFVQVSELVSFLSLHIGLVIVFSGTHALHPGSIRIWPFDEWLGGIVSGWLDGRINACIGGRLDGCTDV